MAKADHRASLQPASMPGYSLPVYEYRRPPELSGQGGEVYPVIVVGAGLAGLTAALELGSRGIRTVILDEDNTVGAAGLSSRGICYAKRSLEILDRFGVASRIRAKGVTWNEGEVYRGEARIYRFNLQPESDQKFPAFVNLQQFYVEQYLVEAIAASPAKSTRPCTKRLSRRFLKRHGPTHTSSKRTPGPSSFFRRSTARSGVTSASGSGRWPICQSVRHTPSAIW